MATIYTAVVRRDVPQHEKFDDLAASTETGDSHDRATLVISNLMAHTRAPKNLKAIVVAVVGSDHQRCIAKDILGLEQLIGKTTTNAMQKFGLRCCSSNMNSIST